MEERSRLQQQKEARRIQKLTGHTMGVIHYGLWQLEEGTDLALLEIEKESEKTEAIKAQLNSEKQF